MVAQSDLMSAPHFLDAAVNCPEAHAIRIERSGAELIQRIEMAGDSKTRRKGLLGRGSLDPGTGFLIAPTQGVHTFGMRFSIDIIGVARDGRVVKIREDVPPRRVVLSLTAFAILELAAGVARRTGVAVGDRLVVVSTEQPTPL